MKINITKREIHALEMTIIDLDDVYTENRDYIEDKKALDRLLKKLIDASKATNVTLNVQS